MVRTTLGAEVDTTVTVSGSESVDFSIVVESSNVPDTGVTTTIVRPPSGSVYELLAVAIFIPSPGGQSSEDHSVLLRAESEDITAIEATASGDKRLLFDEYHWRRADVKQLPPDVSAQAQAVKGIRADSSNGFQVQYINSSGTTQTNDRRYRFWLREIAVSES